MNGPKPHAALRLGLVALSELEAKCDVHLHLMSTLTIFACGRKTVRVSDGGQLLHNLNKYARWTGLQPCTLGLTDRRVVNGKKGLLCTDSISKKRISTSGPSSRSHPKPSLLSDPVVASNGAPQPWGTPVCRGRAAQLKRSQLSLCSPDAPQSPSNGIAVCAGGRAALVAARSGRHSFWNMRPLHSPRHRHESGSPSF